MRRLLLGLAMLAAALVVIVGFLAFRGGEEIDARVADFESPGDATRANSSFWTSEFGAGVYNPDWKDNGGAAEIPQDGEISVNVVSDADGTPCYSGDRCLRLEASGPDAYARVLARAGWSLDEDVWWGGAILLPRGYYDWTPDGSSPATFRWENFEAYGDDKDNGGFHIWGWEEDTRFRLTYWRQNPPGEDARNVHLVGPLDIPEGRWVWIDVRQRFSQDPARRVNEVWVDGRLVGRCNGARCPENYDYDRPFRVDYMRWGAISWKPQRNYLFYDRLYVGRERLDVLG